jgi:hypothetical protein
MLTWRPVRAGFVLAMSVVAWYAISWQAALLVLAVGVDVK